jgi:hypothetical protein
MFNTYIYHQLPATCFGVCYTIFRETIALMVKNYMRFAMLLQTNNFNIFKIQKEIHIALNIATAL